MTCHLTNGYLNTVKHEVAFEIITNMMQGWDFTIRRLAYEPIPEELLWLCGDDWIWTHNYLKGLKGAVIHSSPIIHYQGASARDIPLVRHGDLQRYDAIKKNLELPTLKKTWEEKIGNLKPVN